ncbi:MAG: metallophosphoesterase [Tissierellia bacterium]|nr:metallophosphoesterase [Tissierellia bacterium]
MKILYFTDTHIRGTNPKNRIDDFYKTLLTKFEEVLQITIDENIDFVLHGGDLFDRPDISVSVVGEFSKILNRFPVPIYAISGNHDIFGHNPDTLHRTMLGLISNLGVLNIINDKKIILKKDIKVQLTGAPYTMSIDDKNNHNGYILNEKDPDCDYAIHMTHGFLVDKPFLKDVKHTLITDILDTKADITLGAHYHYGFPTTCIEGKYFINPGALVRISNSLAEMKRKVKIDIIELSDTISIREVPLQSARPGTEVLDRSEIERHKFKGMKIHEFKEIIDSSSNLNELDIFSLLQKIAENEQIPQKVRDEALHRVEKAQIEGANYK